MNILVSAAALRTSGARTIYQQFIDHLSSRVDGNHYYVMVDKSMEMNEIPGVEYWIIDISSKFKRLVYDYWGMKVLLKNKGINFDLVISLQNVGIRSMRNVRQIIYYHQSLPFFNYNFNIFKKGELLLMLYKYIYPFFVNRSIGAKTEMIAQIPSIKDGIISKYKLHPDNVHVLFPDMEKINVEKIEHYSFSADYYHYIYPATGCSYKRHSFLVDVIGTLHKRKPEIAKKIRIHFTLTKKNEKSLINKIRKAGVMDNFVFHGIVPHNQILSMYKSSNGLLFPSVIETLGLPLIECAHFGKTVIACDMVYAHEVLKGYNGVKFVNPYSEEEWANALCDSIFENKEYPPLLQQSKSSWEDFFDIVRNG